MIKRFILYSVLCCLIPVFSYFPPSAKQPVNREEKPSFAPIGRKSVIPENAPTIADWSGIKKENLPQQILSSAVSFEPLQESLYHEPYFIFQATYGEKASDFYLFSLNTQSGELTKIHKGYHRSFRIEGNRLVFTHTDHVFMCIIPEWKNLQEVTGKSTFLNEKTNQISFVCEIPDILRSLDVNNIHCVMEGSFTKPGLKELIMISGRKDAYRIVVYQNQNQSMIITDQLNPRHSGKEWNALASGNEYRLVNFRQAIFEDFDKDHCLELIINGVKASWSANPDPLLFIDISQPRLSVPFQVNKSVIYSSHDPELIRLQHEIFFVSEIWNKERTISVYQVVYQKNDGKINFVEQSAMSIEKKKNIQRLLHSNKAVKIGPTLQHLSFAKTGRNLTDAGNPLALVSVKLPTLMICPLYNANNPELSPKEKLFHSKRNEFLQGFVQKLDTGWIPFPGFADQYAEMFQFLNDDKAAYSNMKAIKEVIPVINQDDVLFVVLIGFKKSIASPEPAVKKDFLFLFNSSYLYMGSKVLVDGEPDVEGNYELYIPLPEENAIFVKAKGYRSLLFTAYVLKENELTIPYTGSPFDCSLLSFRNQFVLNGIGYHHYLGTTFGQGGNGVGFFYGFFINPVTKENLDLEFLRFFEHNLDYLYFMYHYFDFKTPVRFDISDDADAKKVLIPYIERYEKMLYYHEMTSSKQSD